MAYPSRGLGESFRSITGVTRVVSPVQASPGVASMRPGGFVVQAAPSPGGRTGPSNDDVLRSLYGSVEKGRAVQAASIAEAQQRTSEQVARDYAPGGIYGPRGTPAPPEPPMLAPHDMTPSEPEPMPVEAVDESDVETEGDVIEEVAEGDEEGDSEFSGWGIGMGERPVGVAFTRREVARMGDVRRNRKRKERRERDMRRDSMPRSKALKRLIGRTFPPGVNLWRT